jgi:hypothetical protein
MRLPHVQPALLNQAVQLVGRVGGPQAATELRSLELRGYSEPVSEWVELLSRTLRDGGADRPPPETCVRVQAMRASHVCKPGGAVRVTILRCTMWLAVYCLLMQLQRHQSGTGVCGVMCSLPQE